MVAAEQALFDAGTDSFQLMTLAGEAAAAFLHEHWPDGRVQVLCGPGGNGGDGFVAAAALKRLWRDVDVFLIGDGDVSKLTGDIAKAAALWEGPVKPLADAMDAPHDVVLDALFGGGLSRPLEGAAAALAQRGGVVVSIDVPSGIHGHFARPFGPCFQASGTLTFAALRPAHVLQPAAAYCGLIGVADIGIQANVAVRDNSPGLWGPFMPRAGGETHKHQRGHLKVMSGGLNQTGAARLAAKAGLRAGSGLVTVLSPPSALMVNASHLTAIMLDPVASAEQVATACETATAVIIGPAAGATEATKENVAAVLASEAPAVIDADALTVFEDAPDVLFKQLRAQDILTPHVGEFKRLFGDLLETSANKIEATQAAAAKAGCVVLLKGADTVIATPDGQAIVNTHSTYWLATAGSGDVLAGIIGGLKAQGTDSLLAASMGAWLHGEAGRRVGAGLIAEDLETMLPNILSALHGELQG
jgi:hydroxyethylthiazole kinase-like uncharacterized protein yjeF